MVTNIVKLKDKFHSDSLITIIFVTAVTIQKN